MTDSENENVRFRALVFDLAGVLLDFRGPDSILTMSNGRVDEAGFFRFWHEAACAHDLHCGRCTPEQFAEAAVRELRLNVTPEAFLADYKTWFRGPFDGALELLAQLRPRFTTACLSNANELDVKRFGDELQLHRRVDGCFYSNELGLRKPDAAIYRHVSRTLAIPTHEIAFFDDSAENVRGARAVGMHAYHVTGFEQLRQMLARIGAISDLKIRELGNCEIDRRPGD